MDCLFVCLYGMCCDFSAISFLKEHHSISDMFWVQFLLLVAWCFLFPDVLLLILLPCTVLVFYSLTLYLYICNNNRPFARPGHMVQKLHILVSKLHSGTSKTMHLPLFWKSHCATFSPVYIILYHVTGSCKGPIT